jgi:tRNA pseudouridine55 synthase
MELDGYLNVLKPPGWTSHDVVARLRRLAGLRRIGHTGTLDPAAIGVLPVALGRSTRTVSSPIWDRKQYLADVCFGSATDTDDAEGETIQVGDIGVVNLVKVSSALATFVGVIRQRPPAYSAVHVAGQRSYRRARLGARELPPERSVQVDNISIVAWKPPLLSIRVQCHSGTYVRSLARDLGEATGCPAHLSALVRLRVGPFALESALDLAALEDVASANAWSRVLWEPDVACRHLDAILSADQRQADLGHGRPWACDAPLPRSVDCEGQSHRVYDARGRFLGQVTRRSGMWHPVGGLLLAEADA